MTDFIPVSQRQKTATTSPTQCLCGSNKRFDLCCKPYLKGIKQAGTAKALMKSRFTAYCLKDENYLNLSWHPNSRPKKLSLVNDSTQWQQLKILGTKKGKLMDKKGWVAFAAFYQDEQGIQGVLKEESMFVREQGQWLYHSGITIE